ncbi:MAG TPA: tetratricopeptide repeat protein [Pirellulales bacterium]|nr:tetratricopeptide repeat protein [Pirellulales bacterium]
MAVTSVKAEKSSVGGAMGGRRGGAAKWLGLVAVAGASVAVWPGVQLSYRLHSARNLLASGDAERALVALRSPAAPLCKSAEQAFLTGVAMRRANQLHKSQDYFRRAEELGWPLKEIRPQEMMAAFQAGDPAAEGQLKGLLSRPIDDDTAEQVYEALAKGYFGKYWLNQALITLKLWIDWRPLDARPRHLRAMIYGLVGDIDEQINDFSAIVKAVPDDFAAHALLADALLKKHDVEGALQNYRWCREHDSADPLAALGIAVCLRRKGRYDDAAKVLAEVSVEGVAKESRARILAESGELALELGDAKKAVVDLRQAAEILVYDGPTHYSYGMALARTGDKQAAKDEMKRAEELTRRHERLYDLERQLAARPNDATLRYEAAMLLKEQNLHQEAQTLLLTALKFDPDHAEAHAALADYYEQQGQAELAAEHRALAASGNAAEQGAVGVDGS